MNRTAHRFVVLLIVLTLCCGNIVACDDGADDEGGATAVAATILPPPAPADTAVALAVEIVNEAKWSLWSSGTQLRGANIYQRRVYPELDGTDFMGPGPVGPPYTQDDFDQLAAMGANYVNISHPGLFSETPPYGLDTAIQGNLDALLTMAARANLYTVISFRTGPGRAEFSVCCLEDAGDWYEDSYLNDAVWQNEAAQNAWEAMWLYTAERYRDNPIIVGYDLMVEPNANEVVTGEWHDPEDFYDRFGGTPADWNQLFPRIVGAIRQVDGETPIIVGGMGYSGLDWLPYLEPVGDPRTVYAVHQYAPFLYTHQWWDEQMCRYPGECDTDWDGAANTFDRGWLETRLAVIDAFMAVHNRPVVVNEFGLMRWVPGAAAFMDHQIAMLEQRGLNYALWAWEPAWEPWAEEVDAFNFRLGPDPDQHSDQPSNELMEVIADWWQRNTVRPR